MPNLEESKVHTRENWQETIESMHSGAVIEVNEEVFDYFLEVLPPIYMGRMMDIGGKRRHVLFGFAEGAEPITAFWREWRDETKSEYRFFCQRTTEVNRG